MQPHDERALVAPVPVVTAAVVRRGEEAVVHAVLRLVVGVHVDLGVDQLSPPAFLGRSPGGDFGVLSSYHALSEKAVVRVNYTYALRTCLLYTSPSPRDRTRS